MKQVTINLYSFSELNEDAQQKAIESLYDINVDYDWWEFTYEDAATVGIKITEFDINSYCKGEFTMSGESVAHAIFDNHGEMCETYKTAKSFMEAYNKAFADFPIEEDEEGYDENESDRDSAIQEAEEDFLQSILEDYRIILQKEYEYQTSEEAIKETIECNEYTFTEDGKLRNS